MALYNVYDKDNKKILKQNYYNKSYTPEREGLD